MLQMFIEAPPKGCKNIFVCFEVRKQCSPFSVFTARENPYLGWYPLSKVPRLNPFISRGRKQKGLVRWEGAEEIGCQQGGEINTLFYYLLVSTNT